MFLDRLMSFFSKKLFLIEHKAWQHY
jgi:hypothetical protein